MNHSSLPFWLSSGFVVFNLISLISLFSRYIILAVLPYKAIQNNTINLFLRKKFVLLNTKLIKPQQIKTELRQSMLSLIIFSIVSLYIYIGYHTGLVQIYFNISDKGWVYYFFVLFLLLLIQDLWFYVIHRMLHHTMLFKWGHKTHHLSQHTTPLTAFSFDPFEAFLHAMIAVVAYSWFPVHPSHFLVFQLIMNLQNLYVHSGFEWIPKSLLKQFPLKYFNSATDHHNHHQQFKVNYGIYTTIWDRLLGTYKEQ